MRFLISLPLYKREWILPEWLRCIEDQTVPLKDIGFLFLMANESDDPGSYKVLFEWQAQRPDLGYFDVITDPTSEHKSHVRGSRSWRMGDFSRMAGFRNTLMDRARELQPENYFSLDSDILLTNPRSLEILSRELVNFNAVNPLIFMSPSSTEHPSVLSWSHKTRPGCETKRYLNKYQMGKVFQADVIMGAVMMDPEAYVKSRYITHVAGEDVGWASSMQKNGLTMGCVSYLYCPHVMHEELPENASALVNPAYAPGVYSYYQQFGDDRGLKCLS